MIKIGDTSISKIYIGNDEVQKIYLGDDLVYGGSPTPDYKSMYFTFEVLSAGTVYLSASRTSLTRSVEYSINDGAWTSGTFASGSNATQISVQSGDIVKFRGDNADYATARTAYTCFSGDTDVRYNIYGNLMSLIDSTGFTTNSTLTNEMTFRAFFTACTGVVNVENLIFPEVIQSNSFKELFAKCTNLTTAPKSFPATALTESCYANMFQGCTGLTTVPTLPAMTIVKQSYEAMFSGCTSLTTAPELPATTLGEKSYNQMFYGCTSLTTAPSILATTLGDRSCNSMFVRCTSLTTAPELPATVLSGACYGYMFSGCSSLNYIKCLATDIPATSCTTSWVSGVAPTGTFVKHPSMSSWTTGANGIPEGWTVQNNT